MKNDIKHQLDCLQILLEDWADWMKGYSGIRGYANHTPGISGGGASQDFESMCDDVMAQVCKLVDAAVDDLPPGQSAAINKRYGVAAVFRFPRGNYEELLAEAHATLMQTLPKKGVVI